MRRVDARLGSLRDELAVEILTNEKVGGVRFHGIGGSLQHYLPDTFNAWNGDNFALINTDRARNSGFIFDTALNKF